MTTAFIATWFPYFLSAISIAATVVARSKQRHAGLLNLLAQAGWLVYIVAESAWVFLPLIATLTILYWSDHLGLKREGEREARDPWKDTVLDALVASSAFCKEHENDPDKALTALVKVETAMALDPVISIEAEALVQRGRDEANGEGHAAAPQPDLLLRQLSQLGPLPETASKTIRYAGVQRREAAIEWEDTGVPGIEVTEIASAAPAPWKALAAA